MAPLAMATASALWSVLSLRGVFTAFTSRGAARALGAFTAVAAAALALHAALHAAPSPIDLRPLIRQVDAPLIAPPPLPSVAPAVVEAAAPPAPAAEPEPEPESAGEEAAVRPRFVKPRLEQCQGALVRMEIVLLLELLLECVFAIVGCVVLHDTELRRAVRKWFSTLRLLYTIPVVVLNLSVLWLGPAPTGSCLAHWGAVRIVYAHLLLYAVYCVVLCVLRLLVSKEWMACWGSGETQSRSKDVEDPCGGGFDVRRTNDWGNTKGGVTQAPPSRNMTFVEESVTASARPLGFTCCGLFRVEP